MRSTSSALAVIGTGDTESKMSPSTDPPTGLRSERFFAADGVDAELFEPLRAAPASEGRSITEPAILDEPLPPDFPPDLRPS